MLILLGIGDKLSEDAFVDNHICANLCEYNSNKITCIMKHKMGTWHVTDYNFVVLLPQIRNCPHCGWKLNRRRRKNKKNKSKKRPD
ncbi:hypothetical protein A3G55_02335 [Candidatus Giovannonibacteria bacterium RIFCSPLOWO2_12_FULL_44_25]|uniref:Uncharacterized protein n=3 Tax=Candidatus Giovannoniibacteriota TaxID=1752738 RepID=A0A0G1KML4_9BACT|nr:MAG: hypothetical protein UW15_C0001G0022 [Parcubacteria group bacterium GW2011_GWC1_44_10]KKT57542.1 MAG: hypothetical protein UW49_C0003G0021 [Candidatus Giovannonibacteria bacterium GW2011_GWB1_44_23]KKT59803.1 MAG: hypothetical protein UW53_C0007G0021 [Candidatus Giovannonibacteria bacterium GW2011_GWA1_44_25]OGF49533.1 MAG: hypothetical protein A2120_00975 [Candidatus Giovannonibacteria bacterium GWA2_45_15]OGF60033.1 MAG: hypothetical protein A2W40_00520 [Candidatus Giovannonibacteria 